MPTYGGRAIVAYFFSTSGGRTENIENVWGGSAVPYLKSVSDPYDKVLEVPHVEDGPYRYSETTVTKKLGRLVRGRPRAVYVTKRGRSPRVVKASVLGTSGASAASGWTLRNKLGLRDSWFWVRYERLTGRQRCHDDRLRREGDAQRAHVPSDMDGEAR